MDLVTGIPIICFVKVGAQMAGYVEEPVEQPCLALVKCVVEEETPYQKNKRLVRLHEKREVISRLGLGPRQEEADINYRKQEVAEVISRLGLGPYQEEADIDRIKQEEAEVRSILGL